MEQEEVDLSPLLRIYSDGEVERLTGTATVPPSDSGEVLSKDIPLVSFSVRLYIPKSAAIINNDGSSSSSSKIKLPVVIYFHGGAFCLESAASPTYHNYLNTLVSQANVIAVSVDYRRAPEYPLPTAYHDSWAAITWVGSHSRGGGGDEEWLNVYGDMEKVFFAGDSAGANIAHHMGLRFGGELENQVRCSGMKLLGVVLVHPYFMATSIISSESVDDEKRRAVKELLVRLWHLANPNTTGCDDPLINPAMDPTLSTMGSSRVLVFVAEREVLRDKELRYKQELLSSGWQGVVDVILTPHEDHIFHLLNPTSPNALLLMQHFVSFITQPPPP